jgi:methionine-R-sulfoxide reductase
MDSAQAQLQGSPKRKDKVVLSDEEWKKRLTPEQYKILRHGSTEAPFCSPLYDNKKVGTYFCLGCGLPLFRSDAKFHSGTGWPSFFQPASKDAIWTRSDNGFGMVRTEVLCARCDGHLGHVFDDAPQTKTGLRYCINGEVLKFVEDKKQ